MRNTFLVFILASVFEVFRAQQEKAAALDTNSTTTATLADLDGDGLPDRLPPNPIPLPIPDPFPLPDPEPVPFPMCFYTNPKACLKDPRCWWDDTPDCLNQIDCGLLPPEKCKKTRNCIYTPKIEGFCQAIPFGCQFKNKKDCVHSKYCQWNPNEICVPDDPQPAIPDCSQFNEKQCKKNNAWCMSKYYCGDYEEYCEMLTPDQCANNKYCQYNILTKPKCEDNGQICAGLNQDQCKENYQICDSVQKPGQCINPFDCSGFNADQCKLNYPFCKQIDIPGKCIDRPNKCAFILNDKDCSLQNGQCSWDPATGTCNYIAPCKDFSVEKCLANPQLCEFTAGTVGCTNSVDCSAFSNSREECQQGGSTAAGVQICRYIPGSFSCQAKQYGCAALSDAECQRNKLCTFTPGSGICQQVHSFGCNLLTPQQCMLDKRCRYQHQCMNKKLIACKNLSISDCQLSKYCHVEDLGKCNDRPIKCPQDKEKCEQIKYCDWIDGQEYNCKNRFDCSTLSPNECSNNFMCYLSKTGCKPKIK